MKWTLGLFFLLCMSFAIAECGDGVCSSNEVCKEDCTAFIRGDVSTDGTLSYADAIALFNYYEGHPLPCYDAADVDDDGILSREYAKDAVALLRYMYSDGSIAQPFPRRAVDITEDSLGCESYGYEGSLLVGHAIKRPCRCEVCFSSLSSQKFALETIEGLSWMEANHKATLSHAFSLCSVEQESIAQDLVGYAHVIPGSSANTLVLIIIAMISLCVYLVVMKVSRK